MDQEEDDINALPVETMASIEEINGSSVLRDIDTEKITDLLSQYPVRFDSSLSSNNTTRNSEEIEDDTSSMSTLRITPPETSAEISNLDDFGSQERLITREGSFIISSGDVVSGSFQTEMEHDKTQENVNNSTDLMNSSSSLIMLEETIPVIDIRDSPRSSQGSIIPIQDLSQENILTNLSQTENLAAMNSPADPQNNKVDNFNITERENENNLMVSQTSTNIDRLSTNSDIQITGIYQVEDTPTKVSENGTKSPNLEDTGSPNLDDINSLNVEDMNSSNVEDINSSNVDDMNNTNIEDMNNTNIEDMNNTNTKDISNTNIEDMNNTNIEDMNNTNIEDMNNTNIEEMNNTNIEDMNNTNIEDMHNTNIEEMNNTNTEEMNNTNTEDMNNTNTEDMSNTNLEDINITNIEDMHIPNVSRTQETKPEDRFHTESGDSMVDTFKGVQGLSASDNQIFLEPLAPASTVSKEIPASSSTDTMPNSDINEAGCSHDDSWTFKRPNSETEKSLDNSASSPSGLAPLKKHISFNVDVVVNQTAAKDNSVNEILNITCEDYFAINSSPGTRLSESSGAMADVSRKGSPVSSSTAPSTKPYHLRGTNRFSHMSSSSSSSIPSSASALAHKIMRDEKLKKKESNYVISEERITELKDKWNNYNEIWKVLDFIDKYIMSHDCTSTPEDLIRFKLPDARFRNSKTPEKLEQIEEVLTPISTNKPRSVRTKRQAKVKFQANDSENEIPKKRRKAADKTDESNPLSSSMYMPGDSVFAKWSDRKFYAATLMSRNDDGKWTVNFYDDDHKVLSEEFILKTDEFTMIGQRVYAAQYDSNFLPGIITGCELKDNELHYIIARDDQGDISVPAKFILITESQARQIKSRMNVTPRKSSRHHDTPTPILNTSNRATRSKTRKLIADSPKPSGSGTQKDESDSEEEKPESVCDGGLDYVSGIEPELHGVYENCVKLKGKSLTGRKRFARTKSADVDANVLGPVPDEGSKYFKNMHVLLTCTRPQSPKACDSASGSECSNSESFRFSNTPFVKDRLKLQLEMGGAHVYTQFDEISQRSWKNTYLISNRPNISAKYIQSIATGIKLISHDWVIRCCNEKRAVPLQELPVGWSIENRRFYSYFDRKYKTPLKKQSILVVDSADKNFYKFWSRVCSLAEANVGKLMRDSNLENVICVVSECGYRDELVDRVLSHNVPLVSTMWLIQTLIHGELRDYDKLKCYRAEYAESD